MSSKSFTLIELLVVISVIGLLSSIVLVSTKGLREKARIAKTLEFSQSVQNALGSEAVGIWGFDESAAADGASLSTAQDASGYNNNGTCSGAACPTYTSETPQKVLGQGSGKFALSFDGVDDYVNAGNGASLNITSAITIEAWVKPVNFITGSYEGIVYKYSPTDPSQATAYGLSGDYNTQNIRFWISATQNGANLLSNTALQIGTWYHIVGTYTSGNMKLYINGIQEGSAISTTGDIQTGTQSLKIGFRTGETYWNGIIDEVRIYSQALSLSQIQQHYAEGLEKHRDLVIK